MFNLDKITRSIDPRVYFTSVIFGSYRRNRKWYNKLISEGVTPGEEINVGNIKTSDTIFILGTGSSVCEYTNDHWEEIERHDSLGFNDWILHDFTPTIFGTEFLHKRQTQQILNMKEEEYKKTPIIFKSVWRRKKVSPLDLPEYVQDNLITFFDLTIPGETVEETKIALKYLRKFGITNTSQSPKYILKKTGSLIYYIMLAVRMGYKQIVLCGVDLNDSDYFFEQDRDYYKSKNYPIPDKNSGDIHATFDPSVKSVPVDGVIDAINGTILQPQNIDLYIGAKSSALFPEYPYYFESI